MFRQCESKYPILLPSDLMEEMGLIPKCQCLVLDSPGVIIPFELDDAAFQFPTEKCMFSYQNAHAYYAFYPPAIKHSNGKFTMYTVHNIDFSSYKPPCISSGIFQLTTFAEEYPILRQTPGWCWSSVFCFPGNGESEFRKCPVRPCK